MLRAISASASRLLPFTFHYFPPTAFVAVSDLGMWDLEIGDYIVKGGEYVRIPWLLK
jgi:hypothetical protein